MHRYLITMALTTALAFAAGCGGGDSDDVDPDPDTGADTGEDTQEDPGTDAVDVVDEDSGNDGGTDATEDAEPDVVIGDPCTEQRDCQEFGGNCLDGVCVQGVRCVDTNWVQCVNQLNELQDGFGEDAACVNGRCVVPCVNDDACYEGEICTDYGQCIPYDRDLTLDPAGGDARAPLEAGYGEALLNYPIGLPMGGYGERAAFEDGRYALSLRRSLGQMNGLYARAVALDNGERQMLIIRLPMIFATFAIHEEIANHLQELTGQDWRNNIVINTTHTHSGPARFWHLPNDGATALGAFGTGEFSQQVWDWLTDSIIEAAEAALDDLEPAQLGWEILEAYDMEDHVGADRWDNTPEFDDNRVLLMRIDDMDGTPKAVLFSFAAHGTDNTFDYFSEDGLGGCEEDLEMRLGEEYGRHVPALFINSNSGTMAPAGTAIGHRYPQSAYRMGWSFSTRVWDTLMGIETDSDIDLGMHTHRFQMRYELIGYEPGEWSGSANPPIGGEYTYGAISCGANRDFGDTDHSTHQRTPNLECLALHFLIFNRPPAIFTRSQVSALNIDGLTILTAPGELAQELSWQMIRELRDRHGVDPMESWTWGYSQDHLLYLLPYNLRGEGPPYPGSTADTDLDTYPDFAFSFLQGGYESSLSPWGPRFGDFLVERSMESYARLQDPSAQTEELTGFPQIYQTREEETFPIDDTDPDSIEILTQPPTEVARFDTIEVDWVGGDPGAEMPQAPLVALEQWNETSMEFEQVMLPSYREYTNLEPYFMTRIRETLAGTYEWVVRWEELQDFALGTYRLVISGQFSNAGTIEDYELITDAFDVVAFEEIAVEASVDGDTVAGTAHYPAAVRMRFLADTIFDDPGSVDGNYRMRSPLVPTDAPVPLIADEDLDADGVSIRVLEDGGEVAVLTGADITVETVGTDTSFTATLPAGLTGAVELEITVTDLFGNTGMVTVTP